MNFDAVNFDADELCMWFDAIFGVSIDADEMCMWFDAIFGVSIDAIFEVSFDTEYFLHAFQFTIYNLQFVSVYVKFKVYATFSTSILPFSLWPNLIVLA